MSDRHRMKRCRRSDMGSARQGASRIQARWQAGVRARITTFAALLLAGCAASTPQPTPPAPAVADAPIAASSSEEAANEAASAAEADAEADRAPVLEPYTEEIEYTALDFRMTPVPGGTVEVMTEDGPRHVKVEPFFIAPVETTWDLYDAFHLRLDRRRGSEGIPADAVTRPSNPYLPPDRGYGHSGYAALSISAKGAETFCHWLSLKTGRTYRLPTEAEWKHACRLGERNDASLDDVAWHDGNADFTPHPVGSKQPDALGLFDMKGNVAEWCTTLEGGHVIMGGSFLDLPEEVGCAARVPASPDWNESDPQEPKGTWWLADADYIGFRIVCEPGSGEAKEKEQ